MNRFKRHPVLYSLLLSAIISIILCTTGILGILGEIKIVEIFI